MRSIALLALLALPFLAIDSTAHIVKVDAIHRPTFCAFLHYACEELSAEDGTPLLKNVCRPLPGKPGYYIATCYEDGGGNDITNLCLSNGFPTKPSPIKNQILTPALKPNYCMYWSQECDEVCGGYKKSEKIETCSTAHHNGNWYGNSECYCGHVDFSAWINTAIVQNG